MTNRMHARTAIVTASGNGIGRATARCLAEEGVHVAVIDIDAAGANESVQMIERSGGRAFALIGDCVDPESVNVLAAEASHRLGGVDALVNNMGGGAGADIGPFENQRMDVFERVIRQCLVSSLAWTHAVVPGMIERRYGRIVNIASDSAFLGEVAMSEYVAAKAGAIGAVRSLAREYASRGITVNAVAPGPVDAGGVRRVPKEQLERALAAIPMARIGEPREIGKAVAFFVSSDADYITGQTLVVDGGRVMH